MINLKQAAKNPAYSLGAMIYGLQNPNSTKDIRYELDMETYGNLSHDRTTCYGCAATSTLEVITGNSLAEYFTPDSKPGYHINRGEVFNTCSIETVHFEIAIDEVRRGSFKPIMKFFGYNYYDRYGAVGYCMECDNWKGKVPAFEKVIEQMHEDYPEWEEFSLDNVATQKLQELE